MENQININAQGFTTSPSGTSTNPDMLNLMGQLVEKMDILIKSQYSVVPPTLSSQKTSHTQLAQQEPSPFPSSTQTGPCQFPRPTKQDSILSQPLSVPPRAPQMQFHNTMSQCPPARLQTPLILPIRQHQPPSYQTPQFQVNPPPRQPQYQAPMTPCTYFLKENPYRPKVDYEQAPRPPKNRTPLPLPLEEIYNGLITQNKIFRKPARIWDPLPRWFDASKSCDFHSNERGHSMFRCPILLDTIEGLIQKGLLKFEQIGESNGTYNHRSQHINQNGADSNQLLAYNQGPCLSPFNQISSLPPCYKTPISSPQNQNYQSPRNLAQFPRSPKIHTPLPIPIEELYHSLITQNIIIRKRARSWDPLPQWFNVYKTCDYHSNEVGHSILRCPKLREDIDLLIQKGVLKFEPNGGMHINHVGNREDKTRCLLSAEDVPISATNPVMGEVFENLGVDVLGVKVVDNEEPISEVPLNDQLQSERLHTIEVQVKLKENLEELSVVEDSRVMGFNNSSVHEDT